MQKNYPYIFEQENTTLNKSKSEFILNSTKKQTLNSNKKNNNLQLKQFSNFQNKLNSQIPILTPKERNTYKSNIQFQQLDQIKNFNNFYKIKQNLDSTMFKSIRIKKEIHRQNKQKQQASKQQKNIDDTDDLQVINLDNSLSSGIKPKDLRVDRQVLASTELPIFQKIEKILEKMINHRNNQQQQQIIEKSEIIPNQLNYIINQPNIVHQKIIQIEDIKNKREFLTSVIPKGYILQCSIKRDKTWLKSLYPQFHLSLSNGQYLMSARKKAGHTRSSYTISLKADDMDSNSVNYLGKLKSDFLGTQFILFDSGTSPQKADPEKDIRKIIGVVNLKNNKLGSIARLIQVYLPQFNHKIYEFSRNRDEPLDLQKLYQSDKSKLLGFKSKLPVYNENTKLFGLNFFGRVNKISVKNFILEEFQSENNESQYNLIFGKADENLYHLDVKYPFSPLQAFGIILSSFDYKIAFK